MSSRLFLIFSFLFFFGTALASPSQNALTIPGSFIEDLREFVETPAIPGYEQPLAGKIRAKLKAYSPQTDNLGNVFVTVGQGSPHRLLVAPMDEPGYVVSEITDSGYLRLQRLPQFASPGTPLGIMDQLYRAQPVQVGTHGGGWRDGVVSGLSVHLQSGRLHPPGSSDLEDMYVDIGASSAADVREAGVDLLSPLAIQRTLYEMGLGKMTAPAIGDRFGDAALIEVLRRLDISGLKSTLTVAFVAQQWTGARGLERLVEETKADEIVYVGRLVAGGPVAGMQAVRRAPRREIGSGVLIGLPESGESLPPFAVELKQIADANKIPVAVDYSAPLLPSALMAPPTLPGRTVHLGVATAWPSTPGEMIYFPDLLQLAKLLESYVGAVLSQDPGAGEARRQGGSLPSRPTAAPPIGDILRTLTETYSVSGHEGPMRLAIEKLLPPWAKTETDPDGNLVMRLRSTPAETRAPRILVVAHMDEIGFEVKSISNDGRLEVEERGGSELSFFAGHAALVHADVGDRAAIVELPNGWDQTGFQWPRGSQTVIRVDVGARTPQEVSKLGIKVGDSITIPKKYRPLIGSRANGRSFDDRVGCTALILASWALGPNWNGRDVTFLWSTREEIGLEGAAAAARHLAAEGRAPDYVFAVDTFVSSDSPLESKRFADAALGRGFVIRAVDNSNIVPRDLVERVVKIAEANHISLQYGVTGGGNDGSAFLRYGSIDVALGWPLRYSHSPAEVIDTRDVDALARIIAAISRSW